MDPLREGGYAAGEEGRGQGRKQADITAVFPENYYCRQSCFGKYSITRFLKKNTAMCFSLTCPEGGSLPVMVVVCEAGEARHAAGVVVLEPLEELAQLLPALLLLLQPLILLL